MGRYVSSLGIEARNLANKLIGIVERDQFGNLKDATDGERDEELDDLIELQDALSDALDAVDELAEQGGLDLPEAED